MPDGTLGEMVGGLKLYEMDWTIQAANEIVLRGLESRPADQVEHKAWKSIAGI